MNSGNEHCLVVRLSGILDSKGTTNRNRLSRGGLRFVYVSIINNSSSPCLPC